jgi:hypothetical protein
MKRYLLAVVVVALAATALWTASAQQSPVSIPILNAEFKVDELACAAGGNCGYPGVTGWIAGPQSGVFKTSTVQYPAAPPSGLYVAYLGDGCSTCSTGSILQTLGATLQANTTYTLKVSVGARADYPFTGYVAALLAGNVTLAAGNKATPVGGTFVTEVILYQSGANPPQLGQPLQILVKSLGTSGQANISGVSLTATAQ